MGSSIHFHVLHGKIIEMTHIVTGYYGTGLRVCHYWVDLLKNFATFTTFFLLPFAGGCFPYGRPLVFLSLHCDIPGQKEVTAMQESW